LLTFALLAFERKKLAKECEDEVVGWVELGLGLELGLELGHGAGNAEDEDGDF